MKPLLIFAIFCIGAFAGHAYASWDVLKIEVIAVEALE